MNMISKPDANPAVAAIVTYFAFGLGHVMNGQTDKWVKTLIITLIGMFLCVLPGIIISILSAVDAYQTATRLKNGESIPENEYSNGLLYKICKIIDKKATCNTATPVG